jgi:AraC-like DNA-binding protein
MRPITDIALYWGFANLSHFSRVFREHKGMSPSEFRSRAPSGYCAEPSLSSSAGDSMSMQR